jgi:AraC-like DNA-binding protein
MVQTKAPESKAILNAPAAEGQYHLTRHLPAPALCDFIQRYWIIDWDLRGQPPFAQETVPYYCVNVVFEADGARIWGVPRTKFRRQLDGKGHVFGIKFTPAGFYPFARLPVSRFTDLAVPVDEIFGAQAAALGDALLALDDHDQMIALAEAFLCQHLPAPDPQVAFINRLIDHIAANRDITKVEDIVQIFSVSKRGLQRLFNQYVGVSPKWVIQRCRLHDAVERLTHGTVDDWPQIALELGYFDQAHFIKDFKAVVGVTPAEYARQHET